VILRRGRASAQPRAGQHAPAASLWLAEFEEYDTPETRTENGVARMPDGGEAAWFKDSEGNLVGVVPA
jgi:hypothetical protein